jgi:hypothetical protein
MTTVHTIGREFAARHLKSAQSVLRLNAYCLQLLNAVMPEDMPAHQGSGFWNKIVFVRSNIP